MNNGQMNIASVPAAAQPVNLEATVSVAVMTEGAQQEGGDFAELLSGIQLQRKAKDLPDSGQAEQLPGGIGKRLFSPDAGVEVPAVNLLAQLNVSSLMPPASEPEAQKPVNSEESDVSEEKVILVSEPSDVTSQMALSAYLQPGRLPEVNIAPPVPVDRLQGVITLTEAPAITSNPPVEKLAENVTSEPHLQSYVAATVPTAEPQPAKIDKKHEVSILTQAPIDWMQNAATVIEHPAIASDSLVAKRAEIVTSGPLLPSDVTASVPTAAAQLVKSDRMSDVNIPTPINVDRLQKVATVIAQPELFSAPPDKIQAEQIEEPLQVSVTHSAVTATVPASDKPISMPGKKTVELPALQSEKTAAASITSESELPPARLTASLPATSPESEIEIHLSQPLPITARVTAAAVSADNRSASMAPEIRGARQRLNPEHQIETVRTGNEMSAEKEMDSSLQVAVSARESSLAADSSLGDGNNQGLSDGTSDNQTLAQNVGGQLKTENQRVAAPSVKAVTTEPARQEIPEQVLQQVKERLVHQELKPGSQQITLTLSPDSLGELKMNLNLQGQKLSVEIVTENRAVRDAIVQHTDALKESLARQNITMESFDVTTGGKGSGSQGQNQNAWRELSKQQQQQQLWTSPRGYHTAQADLPSGQAAYQRQQGQSMLDIHY